MISKSVLRRLAHQVDVWESEPFSVSEVLRQIIEKNKKRTQEEFKASLFEAGIIDENGRLTEHYRRK